MEESELPDPLTTPECDCTDLDGFMLNVERLMASELVALSSHEVVAAALFLWCRAWKQRPAASLPDDDRVNAAFSKLPLKKFRKLKEEVLRGFVKCSDGRLYHTVLSDEATRAFQKKKAFQKKRETDSERLKRWRETRSETHCETRFVAEGQGQGQGQGRDNLKDTEPKGSAAADAGGFEDSHASQPDWWPERDRYGRVAADISEKTVYDVGKAVLGANAGGQISRLRKCYSGDLRAVADLILQAHDKSDPRQWFAGVLKSAEKNEHPVPTHEKYPDKIYTDSQARSPPLRLASA